MASLAAGAALVDWRETVARLYGRMIAARRRDDWREATRLERELNATLDAAGGDLERVGDGAA